MQKDGNKKNKVKTNINNDMQTVLKYGLTNYVQLTLPYTGKKALIWLKPRRT